MFIQITKQQQQALMEILNAAMIKGAHAEIIVGLKQALQNPGNQDGLPTNEAQDLSDIHKGQTKQ